METFESLLILMVVVYAAGHIFRVFNLPVIFGELLGGVLVGPLLLNLVKPDSEIIIVLAELGIFFLMLHSGLENDPRELLKSSKKSILISIGGIVIPFGSGYLVAHLYGLDVIQSLFIGVALSITAIAILVRLFKDCKIHNTKIFKITLGAAILDDILALVLFSTVLNIAETGNLDFIYILLLLTKISLFFTGVIWLGFKTSKYMNKIMKKKGFTFSLIIALILGLLAEMVGLHMIIGAFLAGLFIREEILDEKTFNKIEDRVYGLSYSFLGPIFFVSLAFHLQFKAIFSNPWFLLSIVLVAVLGKIIGAGGAALMQKIKIKQALIIGLAMNSRGAVEIIIASIGLSKGIIDEDIFSVLVIMAFATTLISIIGMRMLKDYAK